MPAWVVASCWRQARSICSDGSNCDTRAAAHCFTVAVTAVGLIGQLCIRAVFAGSAQLVDAFGHALGRPERRHGFGGFAQSPPVERFGKNQVPADHGHEDDEDGDGVGNVAPCAHRWARPKTLPVAVSCMVYCSSLKMMGTSTQLDTAVSPCLAGIEFPVAHCSLCRFIQARATGRGVNLDFGGAALRGDRNA